ncbi:hypothetical protein B9Z55_026484 [Caenorhabditis nigoni]|uniref:Uncharacterized protein n=1 Tax=Caenorhabditis nigoni TaxID=1611254 RepID=A0A2G5T3D2_9PELO|nr:hypothetical protein B9Z55_026484 [Caenorhabditis nigoni]
MTSQSSFPTPSDVRRHRGPRRATFGSIKVASIRLHEFRHVADHEFVKIIFTHRDISGMLGGFFGNTEHIHFFGDFPEASFSFSEGQRFFHIKMGTTAYLMEVASVSNWYFLGFL